MGTNWGQGRRRAVAGSGLGLAGCRLGLLRYGLRTILGQWGPVGKRATMSITVSSICILGNKFCDDDLLLFLLFFINSVMKKFFKNHYFISWFIWNYHFKISILDNSCIMLIIDALK